MVRIGFFVFVLVLLIGCGGATEPNSDRLPTAPCDPFGTWKLTYVLSKSPDAYVPGNPAGDDTLTITAGVDGGAVTAQLKGAVPEKFTLSKDRCQVHVVKNSFWIQGGEPWSDEREIDLKIIGDNATGTLMYGCYWNCGGMHGTLEFAATGTRISK